MVEAVDASPAIYGAGELRSGVRAPMSERGVDAATGLAAPVLNPNQPVHAPRALASERIGPVLDVDTSFALGTGAPDHVRTLISTIALQWRVLQLVAREFDVGGRGVANVFTRAGLDLPSGNARQRQRGLDFIATNMPCGWREFDRRVTQSTRSIYESALTQAKSSRRRSIAAFEDHIRSSYKRIKQLTDLLRTAKTVTSAIRDLHCSVSAGHTPDLASVQKIVQTPQNFDRMPELLCDAAFYSNVDPTYIFLDFSSHSDLLQAVMFLGQVNRGYMAPTRRQARAFLKEIMQQDISPAPLLGSPTRALLRDKTDQLCDWEPHREYLARVCRDVISGVRPEGVAESVDLWGML